MTQRQAVYSLDNGVCVGCDRRQRANAGVWSWHAHHVIRRQTLERRGVKPARIRDATYCVLLCWDCHGDQTSAMRRIPLERLPQRVIDAADALGPWAHDALRREHPAA